MLAPAAHGSAPQSPFQSPSRAWWTLSCLAWRSDVPGILSPFIHINERGTHRMPTEIHATVIQHTQRSTYNNIRFIWVIQPIMFPLVRVFSYGAFMLNGVLCCQAWRNDASELMRVDTLKLTNSCHCDEHRMYKHSNTCKSSRRGSTHTEQTHPRYRRPSRVYVSYPPSGNIEQSSSPPVWNDCFILQYKYIIGFILNQVFENEKNEYLLYLNRKNLSPSRFDFIRGIDLQIKKTSRGESSWGHRD